ncbi:N-acyl homoserine lactonase family protein [Paraburkholderia sediminicola]|uniref:N-acyl homoserine lactonase family protein n=1 Tax=Paraburkholderia sediminicola TaxID=458836 RepID=UPI0038BD4BB2
MTTEPQACEVYAIRYAAVDRIARDNFMAGNDIHDGMMQMHFFVWLIRAGDRLILVDTGFSEKSSVKRQRFFLKKPSETLHQLGVVPDQINDVILTHLHYDHAGDVRAYKNAIIHLQDAEMEYATGRCMCHRALNHFFAVEDVQALVAKIYDGNVQFHRGAAQICPGVEVELVGGHTAGLQVVKVFTKRGWIVLASDAAHYYQNMTAQNPFPGLHHTGDAMEAFSRLKSMVDSADKIIPGHDPAVTQRYPRYEETEAYVLHVAPRSEIAQSEG